MNLNLQGKVALVTGGTRGIGRAIVERFLASGADVAFCGRTPASVAEALPSFASRYGPKVDGTVADVREEASVRNLFAWLDQRFGGLDILVNNAGVGRFATVEEMTVEQWHDVIDTNLTGVYHCAHEALPRLKKRGGGWIVNIGSLAAKNAFAGGAAYNASKFGLRGMSEAMMLDHRYESVRVTSILPGSVATEFGRSGGGRESSWMIQPDDVAETVAMVLSLPERSLISQVEIRPSKPRKS
jgi:3-oxoacyl-[acyl-carrier protein] reductase